MKLFFLGFSMKTTLHILSLYCTVAFVSLILINELAVAADANFACGGSVEAEMGSLGCS